MSQSSRGRIGRNEPCWCGSGKKYKKCHEGTASASRPKFHELATEVVDTFKGDQRCLAPEQHGPCGKPAVRAHSISKKSALAVIAKNGHVYQPQTNPFVLSQSFGEPTLRLVGIQNASVFSGFCGSHDASLFTRIDIPEFQISEEAITMLHYRALCRELYKKVPLVKTNETLRLGDRGLPEVHQKWLQSALDGRATHIGMGLTELQEDKQELDELLLRKKYGQLRACILEFEGSPIIACSGYTQPVFDFQGRMLQDLNDLKTRLFSLSFSLIPRSRGTVVVMSWLPNASLPCDAFVGSFLSLLDKQKSSGIIQYVFNSFENYALNPDWWETLSTPARQALQEQMEEWVGPTPFFHAVDPRALVPQTIEFSDWVFTNVVIMR